MARSWRPPERPNFAEFPFRDCPKRVRGVCPVALQSTKTALFDPFLPPSTSKFALRALFVPLFGQSLHALGCIDASGTWSVLRARAVVDRSGRPVQPFFNRSRRPLGCPRAPGRTLGLLRPSAPAVSPRRWRAHPL